MRKLKTTLVLLAFAVSFSSIAQNFEGVVTMSTTNAAMKEDASVSWFLKGDKSRMDIVSKADGHTSEYAIISDDNGMHMVSEGHVTEISPASLKVDLATQMLVSEKQGVSMNGYDCTQLVYTDGKNQTIYWVTNGLGIAFDDIPLVLRRNMPQIKTAGFPVRMEKRDAEGKVVMSQDVVSVTVSAVNDSKFNRN
ncbi:MAG: hypothetical protein RL266_2011 [Bacteroidota bacterium]|jgi:hypothetical protein